jgi:hypothetical protein
MFGLQYFYNAPGYSGVFRFYNLVLIMRQLFFGLTNTFQSYLWTPKVKTTW